MDAFSFFQIEYWLRAWIAWYTLIRDAIERFLSRTVNNMLILQIREIVELFHIVFCVIIDFDVANHLLSISQYDIIFAHMIFKVLVKISATFASQCFYVKVLSFCFIASDATIQSSKRFVRWALDSWISSRVCPGLFNFFGVSDFECVGLFYVGLCKICHVGWE